MERRTHYMVLGVSHAESTRAIRAAYRDLARQRPMGIVGAAADREFRELTHAHDVLSDGQRRRTYDDDLMREVDGEVIGEHEALSGPLLATRLRIFANQDTIRPSFEAMHERLARNYTQIGVPKAERPAGLNVEVLLTPAEAAHGCVVPVGIPTFARCPLCRGSGHDWLSPCMRCEGAGVIEHEQELRLRIPAMLRSGSVIEVALDPLGIRNFYLRLHVFVEMPPV
ncbi:MAG TPA: DnaJ domain-containing protein [Polyangiales bacterium]|nr:DnaJ domain-containing protein [Polyangiales bacterium]